MKKEFRQAVRMENKRAERLFSIRTASLNSFFVRRVNPDCSRMVLSARVIILTAEPYNNNNNNNVAQYSHSKNCKNKKGIIEF
jgi:hypothetical protein